MRELLLILVVLVGSATTNIQACELEGIPEFKKEFYSEYSKFIMISDCVGNFNNCARFEESEIITTASRSYYPANSLNVLKKAYYAFEVHPPFINSNSVTG